ncbi:HNH endonuclease [Roseimicrobium sp. ORNL1]|uniref:HNH endonuclease n=1 Tax=Roseimicrobium sp. ORNL1 TaxID=2711231 RepID=UPI0013E12868|nr:HNH endonuclease [Roseimicrobium sp. ORNL1]QIF02431.1 hypothetical protein G5S37_13155 [Roseimicrobium sp. ORNL1]
MSESQTFEDVTIYSHQHTTIQGLGIMRSLLGYSRIEARRVTVKVESYAQYTRAVSVAFVPRGKRSERSYNEASRVTTVILKGYDHPDVPHKIGSGPEPLLDEKWHEEFALFLKDYRLKPSVEVLLDLREDDTKPIHPPPSIPSYRPAKAVQFLEGKALSVWEGQPVVREHLRRERNKAIVRAKREEVLRLTGKLECEACGFDFTAFYGIDFCEVHHLRPLAENHGAVETKLEELAVVCSNCHRVIHRRSPFLTIQELRAIIQSRRV